jgi:uncharacterized protein (TIGR02001 family)
MRRALQVVVGGALASLMCASPALAQDDPNPGALTFTGSIDFPTVYVFRGIVQESDPGFTMFPAADLGIALTPSITLNLGTWHSLQTGSSGSDGPSDKIHYEEDFYATLSAGVGRGLTAGMTYTAYTSPNNMFGTVKELSFKVAHVGHFNPYGIIAFELSGAADTFDDGTGTYLELGATPTIPLSSSRFTLAVPVKLGMSLGNYYQLAFDDDTQFGYFDVGALLTVPISKVSSKYGSWNVHGGVDFYAFGDATEGFNSGDGSKVVGSIGIGVSY